MISRTVAIGSSVGLHARPASVLAEAVDDSGVEVTIAFDGEEADAASLLEIMTLGAKHGDVVTLSTEDDSAGAVLDSLVELLSRDRMTSCTGLASPLAPLLRLPLSFSLHPALTRRSRAASMLPLTARVSARRSQLFPRA